MDLVCTSIFRASFQLLTKRSDSGFNKCQEDILNDLNGQSFDSIYNRHFLVRQMGDVRIIKLRIQNSQTGYSSAAGYRLVILCNPTRNHISLLTVYPKKGKHSRGDLSKNEYKELANNYAMELKNGLLIAFP